MNATFQGSRKHILKLTDLSGSMDYVESLNPLLGRHASVTNDDKHEPVGTAQVNEYEVPDFCTKHCPDLFDLRQLEDWWLPKQPTGRRPKGATWDLLSTCSVGDKPGLLLVEAKAHENELGYQGKNIDRDIASDQSNINHDHIAVCLASVEDSLRQSGISVNIGVNSHYQLANRIAWAWKLADCGVPVVLLYLGFLGDTHFGDHFKDADHWQRAMGAYMHGVIPKDLPDQCVTGRNGGSFTLLVNSLPAASSEG